MMMMTTLATMTEMGVEEDCSEPPPPPLTGSGPCMLFPGSTVFAAERTLAFALDFALGDNVEDLEVRKGHVHVPSSLIFDFNQVNAIPLTLLLSHTMLARAMHYF